MLKREQIIPLTRALCVLKVHRKISKHSCAVFIIIRESDSVSVFRVQCPQCQITKQDVQWNRFIVTPFLHEQIKVKGNSVQYQ